MIYDSLYVYTAIMPSVFRPKMGYFNYILKI